MRVAYADTSCLLAVALGADGFEEVARDLEECDLLVSSNLLEAELRSALAREGIGEEPSALLGRLAWVHPGRALSAEYRVVLSHGRVRGADLWHLACALYLRGSLPGLRFLTLDRRQGEVAQRVLE